RGFFLELDALSLVQLIEIAVHRAAVKEPLLPAIVTDEPEAAVSDESLDRAACHARLLGRGAQSVEQSSFVPEAGCSGAQGARSAQSAWVLRRARSVCSSPNEHLSTISTSAP